MISETHLFIIWKNAENVRDKIVEDISKKFTILKMYNISWESDKVIDNFISFYSHSQSHLNYSRIRSLMRYKARYVPN